MVVVDLYSKRKKREMGAIDDVFIYEIVPAGLRSQIVHIWRDAIGVPFQNPPGGQYVEDIRAMYHSIVELLRREYGTFKLIRSPHDPDDNRESQSELTKWFLDEADVDKVLDAVELTFQIIEGSCSKYSYLNRRNAATIAELSIKELNTRFKEHGVGYQFADGRIIRVDSQLVHKEVVIPALAVLRGIDYANAQEEFFSAYEHFRHGNKQEALVYCCKCFESTMKVVCTKQEWTFDPRATVRDLVDVCFANALIPSYWQSHFSGLRSVLESAIATPRNRQAGHGAGAGQAPEVPDELVSYVLHMTAATVLFLAESEKRLAV